MFNPIDIYPKRIYCLASDLIQAKPPSEWDNYNLSKIFEYYSCIRLTEETGTQFYEYNDIPCEFKEENKSEQNN